jgi:tRNA(Ile)-lysidine synthase
MTGSVAAPARSRSKPMAVSSVVHRMVATARRHAMFERGSTVVVAVSGGPDSVCMLHALVRARRLLGIRELIGFHFDHRLRPGSDSDARYARRQAEGLGLRFVVREATSTPARGESIEAWARTVRYAALSAVREAFGAAGSAVAHTADDQAETVLLALVRGGGLEAIAGMRAVTDGVVRPLFDVTRAETVAFCRALRLRPRADPTNEDRAYLRVAIRMDVVPVLEAAVGRSVRPTLVRTAALLRDDADLLATMARAASAEVVDIEPERVLLRADALSSLARPIGTRVVREALRSAGILPEAPHVEAVLALAAARPGRRTALPGRVVARREREYVSLSFPAER